MNDDPKMTKPSSNKIDLNRREFLESSTRNAACVTAGVLGLRESSNPNEKLQFGIIGVGSQGQELAKNLITLGDVQVMAICDVDARHLAVSQHEIASQQRHTPICVTNHRQLLERNDLDAIVVATPDHWHHAQAIDVLKSKRHLFLETPIAHTIKQGEEIARVASQANCVVQVGLPQRSGSHFQSAIETIRSGDLGKVHLARAWAVHPRKSIGYCANTRPPLGVDYRGWLGPAEKKPFRENCFHGNWCWSWEFGSGELGRWGTQNLDVALWALNLSYPKRVSATGGIRSFRDDRETPDTLTVTYEYPELDLVWEHRQWGRGGIEGRTSGTAFYGERGTLVIDRSGWKIYGSNQDRYADSGEIKVSQLRNFVDAIRNGSAPTATLEAGQIVTDLCHLGNISHRLGREVFFDRETMSFRSDNIANQFLTSSSPRPISTEDTCPRGRS